MEERGPVLCCGTKVTSKMLRKIREQQVLRAKCFAIQYHSYTAHISFATISSYLHISNGYSGPASVRMTQTIPQQLAATDE